MCLALYVSGPIGTLSETLGATCSLEVEFRDGAVWSSLDSEVQVFCGHLGELKCFWDTKIPGSKTDSNLCLLRVCGIYRSPSLSQRTEESREWPWGFSTFLEDLPKSHETWQWDFRQVLGDIWRRREALYCVLNKTDMKVFILWKPPVTYIFNI